MPPDILALWAEAQGRIVPAALRISLIVLAALAALWLGFALIRRAVPVAIARGTPGHDATGTARRADTLVAALERTFQAVILIVAALTILPEFGIDIAPLLAGAGIVGIALGFGAQALVRDLVAGFFILLEGQYSRGDVVRLAGVQGSVEHVGLRRTILRDGDGALHVVPNGKIDVVTNLTAGLSRVSLELLIPASVDLDAAVAAIDAAGGDVGMDAGVRSAIVVAPRVVRIEGLAGTGVQVKVLGLVRPGTQWDVAGVLRRRLIARFQEHGWPLPAQVDASPAPVRMTAAAEPTPAVEA